MRVPTCAILLLLVLGSACAESRHASQPSAARCKRAPLPKKLEARSVSWQLVVPPHAPEDFREVLVDTCDSIVSLAHHSIEATVFTANEVLATSDGADWSRLAIQGVNGIMLSDIEHAGGRWVSVGRGHSGSGVIAVADSDHLEVFRQVFNSANSAFTHVAFGAGTFVASAPYGVAFSRDGEHWSWGSLPKPVYYADVAFGNDRFVVAGLNGTIHSTDGETWESTTEMLSLSHVAFVGEKFYAADESGSYESSDGMTFVPATHSIPIAMIGGVLVSTSSDPNAWPHVAGAPAAPNLFFSEDAGLTWFDLPLTISTSEVDCSIDPCVVIPQGVLVLRDALPSVRK